MNTLDLFDNFVAEQTDEFYYYKYKRGFYFFPEKNKNYSQI